MLRSMRAFWFRFIGWPRRLTAAACFVLALLSFIGQRHPASATGPVREVVVATHALRIGQLILAGDVRPMTWPRQLAPDAAGLQLHDVIGRAAAGPIGSGELITSARLLDTAVSQSLSPGQVAATVRLADGGQATIIQAGARIDLYSTGHSPIIADGKAVSPDASGPAGDSAVAVGVRVLAVLGPAGDAAASISVVVALNGKEAKTLANVGSAAFLATLRPPQ